ncbi:MAG TPA: hypothetical protein VIP53_03270 [Nitrososphaera sp.]
MRSDNVESVNTKAYVMLLATNANNKSRSDIRIRFSYEADTVQQASAFPSQHLFDNMSVVIARIIS